MPIHDWSRVDANLYHHFHQVWTGEICRALNFGVLPPGYSALIEQHAGAPVPDVLAVERKTKRKPTTQPANSLLTKTPPRMRISAKSTKAILAAKGNRIAIHHGLGEIVCVIEVVSPGNKHSKLSFTEFLQKSLAFLQHGVHLLIVDPFPPSKRDPHGIPYAIWEEIDEEPLEVDANKPLTLSAFAAGNVIAGLNTSVYVEPIGVGDVLPDMPAYLEWGEYVPVPLEATYQTAWANCPADMRELVETGKLSDEG
jgi:hypothetical protein